ncbi:Tn3 family transposase [Streptomyces sp. NPDC102415]|uniref:Tn3 family transposase n=1 Tax=Streptomyces sp. NPDC102415 TaxID=3366173 RepID=UPI0037F57D31
MRQVHGGLHVVESWNSANTVLLCGKDGALTRPDKEHAETSRLTLHLLRSALVHVNALLVQQALAGPTWPKNLSDEDRHSLTARSGPTSPRTAPSAWTWIGGLTRG